MRCACALHSHFCLSLSLCMMWGPIRRGFHRGAHFLCCCSAKREKVLIVHETSVLAFKDIRGLLWSTVAVKIAHGLAPFGDRLQFPFSIVCNDEMPGVAMGDRIDLRWRFRPFSLFRGRESKSVIGPGLSQSCGNWRTKSLSKLVNFHGHRKSMPGFESRTRKPDA